MNIMKSLKILLINLCLLYSSAGHAFGLGSLSRDAAITNGDCPRPVLEEESWYYIMGDFLGFTDNESCMNIKDKVISLSKNSLDRSLKVITCRELLSDNSCDSSQASADKVKAADDKLEALLSKNKRPSYIAARKRRSLMEDLSSLQDISAKQNAMMLTPSLLARLLNLLRAKGDVKFQELVQKYQLSEDVSYGDVQNMGYNDFSNFAFECSPEKIRVQLIEGSICKNEDQKERFKGLFSDTADHRIFGKSRVTLLNDLMNDSYGVELPDTQQTFGRAGASAQVVVTKAPRFNVTNDLGKTEALNTLSNLFSATATEKDASSIRYNIDLLSKIRMEISTSLEAQDKIDGLTDQILTSFQGSPSKEIKDSTMVSIKNLVYHSLPSLDKKLWRNTLYNTPVMRSLYKSPEDMNSAIAELVTKSKGDSKVNGKNIGRDFSDYEEDLETRKILVMRLLLGNVASVANSCNLKKDQFRTRYCEEGKSLEESSDALAMAGKNMSNSKNLEDIKANLEVLKRKCKTAIDETDTEVVLKAFDSKVSVDIVKVCNTKDFSRRVYSKYCESFASTSLDKTLNDEADDYATGNSTPTEGVLPKSGPIAPKQSTAMKILRAARENQDFKKILDGSSERTKASEELTSSNYVKPLSGGRLDPLFKESGSSPMRSAVGGQNLISPIGSSFITPISKDKVAKEAVENIMEDYEKNPNSFQSNARSILDDLKKTKEELAALKVEISKKEALAKIQASELLKKEGEKKDSELDQEIALLKEQLKAQEENLNKKNIAATKAINSSNDFGRKSSLTSGTSNKSSTSAASNTSSVSSLPTAISGAVQPTSSSTRSPGSIGPSNVGSSAAARINYSVASADREPIRVSAEKRASLGDSIQVNNLAEIKGKVAEASGPVIVMYGQQEYLCEASSSAKGYECDVIAEEDSVIANDAGLKLETINNSRIERTATRYSGLEGVIDRISGDKVD
jgi:hypothetical protein